MSVATASMSPLRPLMLWSSRPCISHSSGPEVAMRGLGEARSLDALDKLPLVPVRVLAQRPPSSLARELEPGRKKRLMDPRKAGVPSRLPLAEVCRLGRSHSSHTGSSHRSRHVLDRPSSSVSAATCCSLKP